MADNIASISVNSPGLSGPNRQSKNPGFSLNLTAIRGHSSDFKLNKEHMFSSPILTQQPNRV